MKYPPRFVAGDVEICRFHNYAAEGCIRRVKFGMCMFDHDHCHWCGHHGHRAWECEHAVKAHQSAVVDDALAPAAQPVRDPNDGTNVHGAMNGTVNGVDSLADEIERKVSLEHHETVSSLEDDLYVYVAV